LRNLSKTTHGRTQKSTINGDNATQSNLFGAILVGIIGFAAYRYGNKALDMVIKWGGIVLMLYPYVIAETWQLYVAGFGLCFGIYILRN
jgi:hypothetical protein